MKSCIIYFSVHHNNTQKLVESISQSMQMDIYPVLEETIPLEEYDTVILASGIYMGYFGKEMLAFIEKYAAILQTKKVVLLYTCGSGSASYGKKMVERLGKHGIPCQGFWRCKGYDTYGFFKLVGGISKNHPNQKDIQSALAFVNDTLQASIININ